MQAKIILIVEAPNDGAMRSLDLFVSQAGISYDVEDKVLEVKEFHISMNPVAIDPAKVTRRSSDQPGDDAPEKDSMELAQ